ncbi:MAG: HAD hydrolase family protein [Alphaproteobacteria bacterium]|nr:HAD hydrolase family protein [Alphaproteobacteria bacterium]
MRVLATDLDGTFLGGSDHDRAELYARFRGERPGWRLVFVTGRDLPFVQGLVETGLVPAPDFVIGDVGTTVVDAGFAPVDAVQDAIASLWGARSAEVMAMLADEPGLRLQPGDWLGRRRVSYYYEPAQLRDSTLRKVEEAGLDWVTSADVFFDVLPPGVSKGPTLRRLVEHQGWDAGRVLAAGDTLNDRTLLLEGFPAVAVGNSEDELQRLVTGVPHVFQASRQGTGGILEALHHHRLTDLP